MKFKKTIIAVGVISLLSSIVLANHFLGGKIETDLQLSSEMEIPASAQFYQTTSTPKQSPYNCGPYSIAMSANLLQNQNTTGEEISSNMQKFKIPRLGFLPINIESELKNQGLTVSRINGRGISDEERIEFLKTELAQENLIILLTYRHGYLHYLTLVGYEGDDFLIYDSFLEEGDEGFTIDRNNELPGNDSLTPTELLGFWSEGNVNGLYKWHGWVLSQ